MSISHDIIILIFLYEMIQIRQKRHIHLKFILLFVSHLQGWTHDQHEE